MIAPLLFVAAMQVITYTEVGSEELSSTVTVSGTCQDRCPRGNVSLGAGEIVGRRPDGSLLVLTAFHVVENAKSIAVFVRNGAVPGTTFNALSTFAPAHRAKTVAYSPNVDLALIAFTPSRRDDYAFAPFEDSSTGAASSPGVVVGDPNGVTWTTSQYSFLEQGPTTFGLTCATCGPGDSGGGVFDAGGKLVGILVQQAIDDDSSALTSEFQAVSLRELKLFMVDSGTATLATPSDGEQDVWKRFDAARN